MQPKKLGQTRHDALADVRTFAVAMMDTLHRLQEAVDRKEPSAPTFRLSLLVYAAGYANVKPHAHLDVVSAFAGSSSLFSGVPGPAAVANSPPGCSLCLGVREEAPHMARCGHIICEGCYTHLRGEDLNSVFSVLADTIYAGEGLLQSQLTGGCLLCASAL